MRCRRCGTEPNYCLDVLRPFLSTIGLGLHAEWQLDSECRMFSVQRRIDETLAWAISNVRSDECPCPTCISRAHGIEVLAGCLVDRYLQIHVTECACAYIPRIRGLPLSERDDIALYVVERTLANWPRYEVQLRCDVRRMRGYLRKAAIRRAMDLAKSASHQRRVQFDVTEQTDSFESSLLDRLEICELIQSLAPEDAKILEFYMLGCKLPEIAARLKMPLSTIRMKWRHSISRLRSRFDTP